MSCGMLSPVITELSTVESPSTTTPSRGILSCGRTLIIEPVFIFSADTIFSVPFSHNVAVSGLIWLSFSMLLRDLSTA